MKVTTTLSRVEILSGLVLLSAFFTTGVIYGILFVILIVLFLGCEYLTSKIEAPIPLNRIHHGLVLGILSEKFGSDSLESLWIFVLVTGLYYLTSWLFVKRIEDSK